MPHHATNKHHKKSSKGCHGHLITATALKKKKYEK